MQYRKFGDSDFNASLLGFGVMRLPQLTDADGGSYVDREKAFELLRYAADNGINYFDTALGYHAGTAESILGEALEGGRRAKVRIGTKQSLHAMRTPGDIRRNLENTLAKLRSDYLDYYMIHGIGPGKGWEDIKQRGIIEIYEKFKAEGLIRGVAFSYHGNFTHFKEVMEYYDWDLCTVQQNFMDAGREVTEGVYDYMANHRAALAIMEPLRGGALANAPAKVAEIYDAYPVKRPSAEWAFRYLIDKPRVNVILSGMNTLEQLKENIAIFSQADTGPGCLSTDERTILNQAKEAYESIVTIPCTQCDYCMPCPQNVSIPGILGGYNDGHRYGFFDPPRRGYMFTTRGGRSADKCNNCGECAKKCPQKIDVPALLKTAHETLRGWEE
jgi:hypothetical protein